MTLGLADHCQTVRRLGNRGAVCSTIGSFRLAHMVVAVPWLSNKSDPPRLSGLFWGQAAQPNAPERRRLSTLYGPETNPVRPRKENRYGGL